MNNPLDHEGESMEAVLVEFQVAWYAGRNPDVDRFCEEHPEFGDELRERIKNLLLVMEGLRAVGRRCES